MTPPYATEADLHVCAREPIHLCGEIQPFGFVIIALLPDWVVAHASANVEESLGLAPDAVVGESLQTLLGHDVVHAIGNAVNAGSGQAQVQRLFCLRMPHSERYYDIAVHARGTKVFIEFEPCLTEKPAQDQLASVQGMIARLSGAESMEDFYQRIAHQVRLLTYFDRVMVYRFLEDGSGEVVAEARRGDLEPFLGLRYPATDIPAQARRLYRENWVRAIGDVHYQPVPIVPTLDANGLPLDLSQVGLRSVSPIHRQYLRNMGVAASMSISLIVDGELWGLIACHNNDRLWPSLEQRMLAEMFGMFVSMQLESRLRAKAFEYERRASNSLDTLIGAVSASSNLLEALRQHTSELCALTHADGIALLIDGRWHFENVPLDPAALDILARYLNTVGLDIYTTHELTRRVPNLEPYRSQCAGLMSIPISRRPRDYILLFRREVKETIRWGGNPNKDAIEPNQPLTPRNSFATYIQEVQGKSAPWREPERVLAARLRSALLEVVLRFSEAASEQRRRAGERQAVLIAELNHRVKNLLALIRSMVERSRQGSHTLDAFIDNLQGRITALARAHDQLVPGRDRLPEIGELIAAELSPFRRDDAELRVEGPAVSLDPAAHTALALVLHELCTNACKYGALHHAGSALHVLWNVNDHGDCELRWLESAVPHCKPPEGEGFGSSLIRRTVPFELGGSTEVVYAEDGVQARIVVPGRYITVINPSVTIEQIQAEAAARVEDTADEVPLPQGMTALLVEDNVLIAMETEDMLRNLGVAHVEVCNSVEQALKRLRSMNVQIGILDVNLGSETSAPVAEEMMALRRAFVFATGYNDHLVIPPHLRAAPVVRKPIARQKLLEVLHSALKDPPSAKKRSES
jgi:light-regulated signal transduction histidine kinase (bacteriophytochrome)